MKNFEYVYSNTVAYKDNFSFKIGIQRNPAGDGYLTIGLKCENPAQTWSFKTGSMMRVKSRKNGVQSAQKYYNDAPFTSSWPWDFHKFMLWEDLLTLYDDYGFINADGEITVEVLVYPHSYIIN